MLIPTERHIIMGSNIQNPDGDSEETDPEKILEFTRTPKKAPEYIPRSMALDDLPGGIRVPILKKQKQRLKPKLQENLAGLEELKLLKEKQQLLVDNAKNLIVPRNNQEQTDHSEVDRRSLRSPRRVSCGSLSSISEEKTLSFQDSYQSNLPLNQERSRRPLSVSDVQFIQEEFNDTGNLSENRNGSCSSDKSSTSAEFSLSSCASDDGEPIDKENRITGPVSSYKLNKPLHRSASDNWRLNRQDFVSSFINKQRQTLGRRASMQVDSDIFRPRLPENLSSSEDIKPKLRRASMQCDAIITKAEATQNMSKLISDIKLNYNFPCPLHAVMRQYGSSTSGLQTGSGNNLKDNGATKQDRVKSAKELVEEWQTNRTNCKDERSPLESEKSKRRDSHGGSFSYLTKDIDNDSLVNFRNQREQSFTSDYFGSVERVNSIKSLPTSAFKPRGPYEDSHHSLQIHDRRHSLPTTTNISSSDLNCNKTPSVMSKNEHYLVHKACYSNSANLTDTESVLGKTKVPNDDNTENDVFEDKAVNKIGVSENSGKGAKLDIVQDEGYPASLPNSPGPKITPSTREEEDRDVKRQKFINATGDRTKETAESNQHVFKKGLLETAL